MIQSNLDVSNKFVGPLTVRDIESDCTPLLNKDVLTMNTFTPCHRKVDNELLDIHNIPVKTSLVAQLTDNVLQADKDSGSSRR